MLSNRGANPRPNPSFSRASVAASKPTLYHMMRLQHQEQRMMQHQAQRRGIRMMQLQHQAQMQLQHQAQLSASQQQPRLMQGSINLQTALMQCQQQKKAAQDSWDNFYRRPAQAKLLLNKPMIEGKDVELRALFDGLQCRRMETGRCS